MSDTGKSNRLTRKEFIQKSSAGLLGAGMMSSRSLKWFDSGQAPEKRILGRTGIAVTVLGFGASRTQEQGVLMAALDAGINFLDTGRSYANGQNEVMIGKALGTMRRDLIIQSKIKIRPDEKGDALKTRDASLYIYKTMQNGLNESLKALQTDYIDIWLIHGADSLEIIHHETVMEFFSKVKQQGVIRACGFSSHHNQDRLLRADNGIGFYDVVMVSYTHAGSYTHSNTGNYSEYNHTALETEMRNAIKNGKGIVAMKTCSAGPLDDGVGKPSVGKAIQWVLGKPFVHSAAVAMPNYTQITENTSAVFGM